MKVYNLVKGVLILIFGFSEMSLASRITLPQFKHSYFNNKTASLILPQRVIACIKFSICQKSRNFFENSKSTIIAQPLPSHEGILFEFEDYKRECVDIDLSKLELDCASSGSVPLNPCSDRSPRNTSPGPCSISVGSSIHVRPWTFSEGGLFDGGVVPITYNDFFYFGVNGISTAIRALHRDSCIQVVFKENFHSNYIVWGPRNHLVKGVPLGFKIGNTGGRIELERYSAENRQNGFFPEQILARLSRPAEHQRSTRETFLDHISCNNDYDPIISEFKTDKFIDPTSLGIAKCGKCSRAGICRMKGIGEMCGKRSDTISPVDAQYINSIYNCTGCNNFRVERLTDEMPGDSFSFGSTISGLPVYPCLIQDENGEIIVGMLYKKKCHFENYLGRRVSKDRDIDIFRFPQGTVGQNFEYSLKLVSPNMSPLQRESVFRSALRVGVIVEKGKIEDVFVGFARVKSSECPYALSGENTQDVIGTVWSTGTRFHGCKIQEGFYILSCDMFDPNPRHLKTSQHIAYRNTPFQLKCEDVSIIGSRTTLVGSVLRQDPQSISLHFYSHDEQGKRDKAFVGIEADFWTGVVTIRNYCDKDSNGVQRIENWFPFKAGQPYTLELRRRRTMLEIAVNGLVFEILTCIVSGDRPLNITRFIGDGDQQIVGLETIFVTVGDYGVTGEE